MLGWLDPPALVAQALILAIGGYVVQQPGALVLLALLAGLALLNNGIPIAI